MQTLFASLLAVVTMAIHAQSWKTTLPNMLFGMIGIFIVIGVIILVTYGLNKAFSKKRRRRTTRTRNENKMKPKGARQVPGAFSVQKTGLQNATVYCII